MISMMMMKLTDRTHGRKGSMATDLASSKKNDIS